MAIPLQHEPEIEYPDSDGQPMAESDVHADEMIYLRLALREHFRAVPDVYVAGNLFFYFKQGDPRAVVAPDLFVVKGIPKGRRKKYLLWEEGRVPCFVVEVTSDSTQREDLTSKKDLLRAPRCGGVLPFRSAGGLPQSPSSGVPPRPRTL